MKFVLEKTFKSLSDDVTAPNEQLPGLVVITGENGAGKSNLLEALSARAIRVEADWESGVEQVGWPRTRYYESRMFKKTVLGSATSAWHHADHWHKVWDMVAQALTHFGQSLPVSLPDEQADALESEVIRNLVDGGITLSLGQGALTRAIITRMKAAANKRLIEFTERDFQQVTGLVNEKVSPLELSVIDIFMRYHSTKVKNLYGRWLIEQGYDPGHHVLSDEEFLRNFGPPPWDVFNATLAAVGLKYRYPSVDGVRIDENYRGLPIDNITGLPVPEFSAGEQTILELAHALYVGSEFSDCVMVPELLLLDEPDSALHPSMVRTLLAVLGELFVARYSVTVIMTTHSPTTVALAPEESLYLMRRHGSPRLVKVSRDEALSGLTVGLSTLTVRVDGRRQVFTESEVDQGCYQALYALVRPYIRGDVSLEFIASGRGGQGGATQVIRLVGELRNAGSIAVRGLVDRDSREVAPPGIYFISERYSLENLILDPAAIGALLIRERVINPILLGLPQDVLHFSLGPTEAQRLSDAICERVAGADDDVALQDSFYAGGFCVSIPKFALDTPGHTWDARLRSSFPALNRFGSELMRTVVERVYRDCPQLVPQGVINVFQEMTEA